MMHQYYSQQNRAAVPSLHHPQTAEASSPTTGPWLFASVMVRVWPGDAFGMTPSHVHDWLRYMAFAGVSAVRVYDHCLHPSECLVLASTYEGLTVQYIPWHPHVRYSDCQRQAYEDSIRHARGGDAAQRTWLMHLDVDEYPFSPIDVRPGFLLRYIAHLPANVTQVVMRSLFFGGPSNLRTAPNTSLPIQYVHRQPEAELASQRTKYMARVDAIAHTQTNIVHRLDVAFNTPEVVSSHRTRFDATITGAFV